MASITKICTKCKQDKPLSEFYSNRSQKDGYAYHCKVCKREYGRQYHKDHRERRNANAAKWKRDNPEKVIAYRASRRQYNASYQAKWYQENREKVDARSAEWRRNNPERIATWKAIWRRDNREHVIAYNAQWQRDNPERARVAKHKRRARKQANGGSFTVEEWIDLCKECGNICLACGRKRKLTVDHVIPLFCGGHNDIDNIQPLCKPCNSSKGTKTIDYRQRRD